MPPSGVEWAAFPFFPCQRWVLAECKATRHSSSPDARRRLGIIRAAVGPAASLLGTQTSCGLPPNATRFIARASGIRPALAYLSEFFTKKNPRVDTRDSRVSLRTTRWRSDSSRSCRTSRKGPAAGRSARGVVHLKPSSNGTSGHARVQSTRTGASSKLASSGASASHTGTQLAARNSGLPSHRSAGTAMRMGSMT